jgi:hypothetical protein
MLVVAAKGRDDNKIGAMLEIKYRGGSLAPGFAAPGRKHHKGKPSERVAQFSASQFPQPHVKAPDQANSFRL